MTRANINYISAWKEGETPEERQPEILFFYHNGDQYPTGIRDHFHLLDFLNTKMSIADFKDWAHKNYDDSEPVEIEKVDQPLIYYTGTFVTDYSYVFDMSLSETTREGSVLVYNYSERIFEGSVSEFKEWLAAQED
jgi:hypothetical protein